MQRVIIGAGHVTDQGWIEVQAERYRYFVLAEGPVMVRIALSEYLACEAIWIIDQEVSSMYRARHLPLSENHPSISRPHQRREGKDRNHLRR